MQITPQNPLAYFCAEYGFDPNLPLYAGGLGILAGDTLKAAAQNNFPMVAVGILYRGNESKQFIDEHGEQQEIRHEFDPLEQGLEHVYVDEMPLFIKVHLGKDQEVWLRIWQKKFSNQVTLYLLDSDTDQNPLAERGITHPLYYGAIEELIKQQMILGIGGVKLLHALNIHPALYHINEGRPAFLHWQLIRVYMEAHGMSYEEAKAEAINKTVYTNHTLVAAGNQKYSIYPISNYAQYYANKIGISLERLLADGIEKNPEEFVMTRFALNVARKSSAVSQLHFKLCKETWPEYNWVGITNGVHLQTWQAENIKKTQSNPQQLWTAHQTEKQNLVDFVKSRTGYTYDPNRLVITWARRIAGYKQVEKIFTDIDKLKEILKNPEQPIQLLIAGKAHFGDNHGKAIIKEIIDYMSSALSGHALFIPNYNLDVAQQLVKGSDLWINTPIFGKEASGTSGMKAISNGCLQLSVADGWMAEVDINKIGWILDHNNLSESFYSLLTDKIAPEFYSRDTEGIPWSWINKMQAAINLSEKFSATRMLTEYRQKLYE